MITTGKYVLDKITSSGGGWFVGRVAEACIEYRKCLWRWEIDAVQQYVDVASMVNVLICNVLLMCVHNK